MIVRGQPDILSAVSEELEGGEVQGVQGAYRHREGLQRPCEHDRCEFECGDPVQECNHGLPMRAGQSAGVDAVPDLVLEKAARDERRGPELAGRGAILGKEVRQGYRGVKVDHGSSRLRASFSMISERGATGRRGGGSVVGRRAGVIHPSRTASAHTGTGSERGGAQLRHHAVIVGDEHDLPGYRAVQDRIAEGWASPGHWPKAKPSRRAKGRRVPTRGASPSPAQGRFSGFRQERGA